MVEVSITCHKASFRVTEAPPLGETLFILTPEHGARVAEQRQLALEFERTAVESLEGLEELPSYDISEIGVEGKSGEDSSGSGVSYVVVKTDSASTLSTVNEMIEDLNRQEDHPIYKVQPSILLLYYHIWTHNPRFSSSITIYKVCNPSRLTLTLDSPPLLPYTRCNPSRELSVRPLPVLSSLLMGGVYAGCSLRNRRHERERH